MAEPSNATMLELLTKQLTQNNTGTSNYLDTLKSIS